MIFGKLFIGPSALHTHNDSYRLEDLSVISTRRPFFAAGLIVATMLGGFAWSFADILYPGEIKTALAVIGLAVTGGLCIGQLTLVSRDLRGSKLSDSVMGTYRHLNRMRPQILEASDRAKKEARS
ncbi:hypothetical protein [Pseudoroseicyclus sp. CXY001]|uniref:hypothetical protein n=1 Tax=Pseudoroseicyclus sp. CXY001 TaxID=3242492 RepID=UPI0035715AE1